MSTASRVKAVKEMGSSGLDSMIPGVSGLPGFRSKGSTRTESVKAKFKKRR
jgi:hypothetical protein